MPPNAFRRAAITEMTHQRVICGVVAAGLLAGCRPGLPQRAHKEVVPVTGKIVRANGEPVRRVLINMQPMDPEIGVHCRGTTDAEGACTSRPIRTKRTTVRFPESTV